MVAGPLHRVGGLRGVRVSRIWSRKKSRKKNLRKIFSAARMRKPVRKSAATNSNIIIIGIRREGSHSDRLCRSVEHSAEHSSVDTGHRESSRDS